MNDTELHAMLLGTQPTATQEHLYSSNAGGLDGVVGVDVFDALVVRALRMIGLFDGGPPKEVLLIVPDSFETSVLVEIRRTLAAMFAHLTKTIENKKARRKAIKTLQESTRWMKWGLRPSNLTVPPSRWVAYGFSRVEVPLWLGDGLVG